MSVSVPEVFSLQGGSFASNATAVVAYLADIGLTATASGGVITFSTNSQLASAAKQGQWNEIMRICDANGGYFKYVVAS
jgi:hypothetical protein